VVKSYSLKVRIALNLVDKQKSKIVRRHNTEESSSNERTARSKIAIFCSSHIFIGKLKVLIAG
jgi:hypothetical protein